MVGPLLHPIACPPWGGCHLPQPCICRAAKGPQLAGSKTVRARRTWAGQSDLRHLKRNPSNSSQNSPDVPAQVGPPEPLSLMQKKGKLRHCAARMSAPSCGCRQQQQQPLCSRTPPIPPKPLGIPLPAAQLTSPGAELCRRELAQGRDVLHPGCSPTAAQSMCLGWRAASPPLPPAASCPVSAGLPVLFHPGCGLCPNEMFSWVPLIGLGPVQVPLFIQSPHPPFTAPATLQFCRTAALPSPAPPCARSPSASAKRQNSVQKPGGKKPRKKKPGKPS